MSAYVDLAQFIAAIAAGKIALDAYNDHKDALVDSAAESLARAKDRFKRDKKIKELVPDAYQWINDLPEFQACEARAPKVRVRPMRDSYESARQSAMAASGKGMVGLRRKLAREATLNFIKQTTISFDTYKQIEGNIEEAYTDLRDQALISSVQGNAAYDPSRITANLNRITLSQLTSQADAFNGAAGVAGSALGDLYNNARAAPARQTDNGNLQGSRASDYSASYLNTGAGNNPLDYSAQVLNNG